MELWDAYDREERRTGAALIRGQAIPEGLYHLVCEVLVQHEDGSYLCMRRAAMKESYPGFYEATAGGSALQGEEALECVKRELQEETGLVCDAFEEIGRYVFEEDRCIFHCYVCRVADDKQSVTLQEGETDAFLWMTEREFADFIHSGEMIPTQKRRYGEYFRQKGYTR